MTPEETKNEDIYTINDLTDGEIRSIEYAYGQFIHNAVSGDFAETNDIMDAFRARIKKKPQQTSIPATKWEIEMMEGHAWFRNPEGKCQHGIKDYFDTGIGWQIFNPNTKCWEDWENEE